MYLAIMSDSQPRFLLRECDSLSLQLTFTVDYRVNRPEAEAGLARLENKVKVGTIRATLIIQSLQDTADVTVNAGTSDE